jgi:hypothetical protein
VIANTTAVRVDTVTDFLILCLRSRWQPDALAAVQVLAAPPGWDWAQVIAADPQAQRRFRRQLAQRQDDLHRNRLLHVRVSLLAIGLKVISGKQLTCLGRPPPRNPTGHPA